jgi:hypothetical protein
VLERRAEFQEKKQKFKQRVHIPNWEFWFGKW